MSRPKLGVELGRPGSLVRGPGARTLIVEVAGRGPVWMPRLRGWSCQESTARDVVALAGTRGYDVVVTDARTRKAQLWSALSAAPPPRPADPETGERLW